MNKKEVAGVLEEIAVLLDLSGENPFKARSYTNVARQIEQLDEDINTVVAQKRLREIKGVGEALEQKIEELVTTGRLQYLEDLQSKFPKNLFELFGIPGLGAKRIKTLYTDLKIQSLGELEYACSENRLLALKGFGPKMQEKVLAGIAFSKKHQGQYLFSEAYCEAARLRDWIAAHPAVIRIELAGSIRRRKETVKDVDILVSSNEPEAVMLRFLDAEGIEGVSARGETKTSVVLRNGLAADLRVLSDAQFPFALHYFTGSKEHNVVMRQRAKDRGLKLNEYGLFRGDDCLPCPDERAVFEQLDLPYIPPELREDMGEFALTETPRLIERDDLRGVYHCHTTYSDGLASVREMAEAAQARGYSYIVIADHSQSAAYAGGLRPEAVRKQHEEIDGVNAEMNGFRVIKSIESDIRSDGSLDYPDDVLKSFEVVIASVHSKLDMSEDEATRRLIRAVENPHTTILGHPTGRLLRARAGYPVDIDKVVDACAANRVAIEINASPHRLDLDWRHARKARDKGVKLCISPDAHSTEGLDEVAFGLGVARKGWLGPDDLLNTMAAEELLAWRK